MTRFAFALFTLLTLVLGTSGLEPAEAGKAKVLAIKKAPKLKKGLKVTVVDEMTMDLNIDTGSTGVMKVEIAKSTPYKAKLVAVATDHPTKVEVTYGAVTATQTVYGKVENQPDPRTKNTYVVTKGATGLTVADKAGVSVDAAVAALVTEDWDGIMKGVPIRGFLVGRALAVGVTVALTEAEFDAIFPMDEAQTTVKTFEVTLDKLEKKVARFSFKALFDILDPDTGVPITIDATGKFSVDTKRVLPLTLELAGTVSGTMVQGKQSMKMNGTMTARKAYKFK